MDQALDLLSWAALMAGAAFYLIGAIGLVRMPDVFTRMHATSVSETMGVTLLVVGMAIQAGFTLVAVKLGIIWVVLMVTGPVASHALARAALHDGLRPLLKGRSGELVATPCHEISLELSARLTSPLSSEQVEELEPDLQEGAPSKT